MKRALLLFAMSLVLVPVFMVIPEFVLEPGRDQLSPPVTDVAQQLAQGKYLARAGNCIGCHTARGGSPYAGGRPIATPFGTVFAPNITPDTVTGIGDWTADDFWRALHNGKSKDGSFLYPAFPYPNYTRVTRADSDAMFAYFRTVQPVHRPNEEHQLRFPYNQRILLAFWRALYFRPGVYQPDTGQSVEWNRGAYLVQGLGHCSACHTRRNALGGLETDAELAGAVIPMLDWYAPSLTAGTESGIGATPPEHLAALLKHGIAPHGTVYGPMAEVVRESLQHLSDEDIQAMVGYLKTLPQNEPPARRPAFRVDPVESEQLVRAGAALYEKHCASCHKENGAGLPPHYPPLAGNRSVVLQVVINPVRIVLNGGYPPSTAGNPRPYGMPPFGPTLSDEEVAAVVSYIRNAWGNDASAVSPLEVKRYRAVPAH